MALGRTFFTDMDRVFEDMTRGLGGTTVGFGAVDAYVDVESARLTARFDLPGVAKRIQIESSHGICPFMVENDDMRSTSEAETARTVAEAVEKVCSYLFGLRTRDA